MIGASKVTGPGQSGYIRLLHESMWIHLLAYIDIIIIGSLLQVFYDVDPQNLQLLNLSSLTSPEYTGTLFIVNQLDLTSRLTLIKNQLYYPLR